jgi:hypothetical protein
MKVLLVANNPNAHVPNGGYDLYVHFNNHIHWGKTPEDKSIVAVRKNSETEKHKSFRYTKNSDGSPRTIVLPEEKIVAIGWTSDVRKINADISLMALEEVPDYPKGHSATSGYAAIHYYLNRGHEVFLCGFNLLEASYYKTTKLHLPDFETDMIRLMIAEGLIARHN